MLAGAVGDVEGRLSIKNQIEDKDLRLARYIHVHDTWNRHLNIKILYFEH